MKGQLLLLDITEMSGSSVCIAGIEPKSGRQVRLSDPTPTRAQVRRIGLRTGDLIELEYDMLRRPTPPHVEDTRWKPERLKIVERLGMPAILDVIGPHSFPSVAAAFGEPAFRSPNGNFAWQPGAGARSLATIRVRQIRTKIAPQGGVRAAFRDAGPLIFASTPLQDLIVKTHASSCDGCAGPGRGAEIRREFDGDGILLRVGLTRPFAPGPEEPARSWLQVTNIFARERAHFV